MYELNTSWILWYHSIKDTSWKKSSYTKFYTFNNLLESYYLGNMVYTSYYNIYLLFSQIIKYKGRVTITLSL